MTNAPLTVDEICRKFCVTSDDPAYSFAKIIALRPDRTICELPEIECLFCCHEFTATWYDLTTGEEIEGNEELPCPECERVMYIERMDISEHEREEDAVIMVTLVTHPMETE